MFRSPPKTTKQTSSPAAINAQSEALLPAFARSPSKLVISDHANPINEACEWLNRAKEALGASRNIKTELKNSITVSLENATKIIQTRLTCLAPGPTPSINDIPQPPPSITCPDTTYSVHPTSAPQQDELLIKLKEHSALLEQNNKKMSKLMDKIKNINSATTNDNALSGHNKSYASIAATSKKEAGPSIVVSGEPNSTPQQLVEKVRKSINFREGGYAPLKISPLSKGKLKITFESIENRQHALSNLKKTGSLNAEEERRLDPMIHIKGISKNTPAEEILNVIKDQNPSLKLEKFNIKFKRNNRNENLYNLVLNTSPTAWRKFLELERVSITYQRVHCENFSPFIQCRNCLGFGHTKNRCPATVPTCAKCAKTHTTGECSKAASEKPCCINCSEQNHQYKTTTDVSHRADSENCPKVKSMRARVEAKINYS